jgi:tetratricopeptide (TPR) repeat protein
MKTRHFLGPVVAIALSSSAFGQGDEFAKGNQNYAAGHFQEAIDNYQSVVQSRQWTPNLFYNLGNAYFRSSDFGRAILNYERALALDRRHPESAANLQIAQDESHALELSSNWMDRFLRLASATQLAIIAAIAFWIGAFAFTAVLFSKRRRSGAVALSILSLSILAISTAGAYLNENEAKALAIVTSDNVSARLATADNTGNVLTLPVGTEIKILSRRGDWIYAELPNNLRGWIPAKDAEQVRL